MFVPTRLVIARDKASGSAELRWGGSLEAIKVTPTPGLIVAIDASLAPDVPGSAPVVDTLGGAIFDPPNDSQLLPRELYGLAVRAHIVVFETDVPVEHDWAPQGPHYRVLFTRDLVAAWPP
jgi:hypothetical protein